MGLSDRKPNSQQLQPRKKQSLAPKQILTKNKPVKKSTQPKQTKHTFRRPPSGSKRARDTIKAQKQRIKRCSSQVTEDSRFGSQTSTSTALNFGESSQQSSPSRTSRNPPSSPFNTDLTESMCYLKQLQQQEKEKIHIVNKNYFKQIQNGEITAELRQLVIQWIRHIVVDEKLQDQTLHLAVRYLDRFLTSKSIEKQRLGLIAIVCLLLAAKFEEVYPPSAKHLLKYTQEAYDINQLIDTEQEVVNTLRTLLTPTTFAAFGTFEPLLEKMFQNDQSKADLVFQEGKKIINNAGLQESGLVGVAPSNIAVGAVTAAIIKLNLSQLQWFQTLKFYMDFDFSSVCLCRDVLYAAVLQREQKQQQQDQEQQS